MKYLFKYVENIIAAVLFAVTIGIYATEKIDDTTFIGILGAIATLFFGFINHKIENDKVFKELFESFNKKYDETFNDLLNELRDDTERKLSPKEKNKVIDYFNLCAEEYLWYSKNRIPPKVWTSWKAGIIENRGIKQIREVYDSETGTENKRKSFYGLCEDLGK